MSIIKKRYKLVKMIKDRIDIYFTEYSLPVEIVEKGHTDRDLIFEKKKDKWY